MPQVIKQRSTTSVPWDNLSENNNFRDMLDSMDTEIDRYLNGNHLNRATPDYRGPAMTMILWWAACGGDPVAELSRALLNNGVGGEEHTHLVGLLRNAMRSIADVANNPRFRDLIIASTRKTGPSSDELINLILNS